MMTVEKERMKTMAKERTKTTDPSRLPLGSILGYGAGALPVNSPVNLRNNYLMNFLTDVAGVNPAAAGVLNAIMAVWDAINDPIVAMLSDRTNLKGMGKYRPWICFGSILLGLTTCLAFWKPGLQGGVQVLYYFVVMMLLAWSQTMVTVPWQALNATLSADPEERNRILTVRQLMGVLSQAMVALIVMKVVNSAKTEAQGWMRMALLIASVAIVGGMVCVYSVRRQDYYNSLPAQSRFSWAQQGRIVFKNKPLLIAAGFVGFLNLSYQLNNSVNLYFMRIVLKDTRLIAIGSVITMVCSLILVPFIPKILRTIGKVKASILGLVLMCARSLYVFVMKGTFMAEGYVLKQTHFIGIIIASVIMIIGYVLSNMATITFTMDITDYTEWRFGTMQAGFINSASTLAKKLTGSLAPMIIGFSLAAVGYTNYDAVTPAIKSMTADLTIYPQVITVALAILLLVIYPLKSDELAGIQAELKERRAAENNGQGGRI